MVGDVCTTSFIKLSMRVSVCVCACVCTCVCVCERERERGMYLSEHTARTVDPCARYEKHLQLVEDSRLSCVVQSHDYDLVLYIKTGLAVQTAR